MKQKIMVLGVVFSFLLLSSCGKPLISVDDSTYEPKIVINGFLIPGNPVSKIKIDRNFPLGQTIDKNDIPLSDAQVQITDMESGAAYTLNYNPDSAWFEYKDSDLTVAYGNSYRLNVTATVDGRQLQAASVTTVPDEGLKIDRAASVYGDLIYRQMNTQGKLVSPLIVYQQSENTAFYLLSISSLDAGFSSFIYENPMGQELEKMLERGRKIEELQYSGKWKRPDNQNNSYSFIEVNWFRIWFYGPYRLVLYAGDQNYYHYYNTHDNVMGMDGNLHEPIFDIEGDGIGVFGSAVTDTVYLNVLRP